MNVLVIGSGGREHALVWKINQSPKVQTVFVAPGNAGTAADAENVNLDVSDPRAVIRFCQKKHVGLAVVGPEAPLVDGLVDALESADIKAFGPNQAAAQLEGSKTFCKKVLDSANIPTASYQSFTDGESAERHIMERFPDEKADCPVVVKADGLAAGKGVSVCQSRQEALDAIDRIANQKIFGEAGANLIIEECLHGEEASVLAITDGKTIVTLPAAQDHKPAFDGDTGPNTGGMGAYCPAPIVTDDDMAWIEEHVLVPTVHQMNRQGTPFKGVLYAGLMMTAQGPKVLEYNVRFGDPECQPLLMRLKTDIVDIILATIDGTLDQLDALKWDTRPTVCVVMASEGYPESYETGHVIDGIADADAMDGVKVFHAGTALSKRGATVNAGGRVLGITAIGESIADAKSRAYEAVSKISWQGGWFRTDISDKALT